MIKLVESNRMFIRAHLLECAQEIRDLDDTGILKPDTRLREVAESLKSYCVFDPNLPHTDISEFLRIAKNMAMDEILAQFILDRMVSDSDAQNQVT